MNPLLEQDRQLLQKTILWIVDNYNVDNYITWLADYCFQIVMTDQGLKPEQRNHLLVLEFCKDTNMAPLNLEDAKRFFPDMFGSS